MGKRHTPFFRALHRPQQIMGGERELVLLSMLTTAILTISSLNFVACTLGITLWLICIYVLRRMAKIDPVLSKTYTRQIKYQSYYPAFSRPCRVAQTTRSY